MNKYNQPCSLNIQIYFFSIIFSFVLISCVCVCSSVSHCLDSNINTNEHKYNIAFIDQGIYCENSFIKKIGHIFLFLF